jgi:HD-like signal output (HDOD) protein
MSTQTQFIEEVLKERFKHVDSTLPIYFPIFLIAEYQIRKEVEASYTSALELPLQLDDTDFPYDPLSRTDLKNVLIHKLNIPIIPQVASFIKKLLELPHHKAGTVCSVIGSDPRLTATMLMLANKSKSKNGFIRTVSEAVAEIGIRESLLLAAGTVHIQTLPTDLESSFNLQKYWFHNLACGFMARKAGMRLHPNNAGPYFAAGLIHSLSTLALVGSIPSIAEQVLRYSSLRGVPISEAERTIIGYDHGTLGAALFKRWGLPPDIIQGIREHRSPQQKMTPMGAALQIADTLSKAYGFGTQMDYYVNDIHDESLKYFGFTQKSWQRFVLQGFRETRIFLTKIANRFHVEPPYPPVEAF